VGKVIIAQNCRMANKWLIPWDAETPMKEPC